MSLSSSEFATNSSWAGWDLALATAAGVRKGRREGVAAIAFAREVARRRVGAGGSSGGLAMCKRELARVWRGTGRATGRARDAACLVTLICIPGSAGSGSGDAAGR